jgi:hypothetical protein
VVLYNLSVSWVRWLTPVILATWEAEIRRLQVGGQNRQKVQDPISVKKKLIWWRTPVIPATEGNINTRTTVQHKSETLCQK